VQLESRVFSDAGVRKLAEGFVCVKIDPRTGEDQEAYEHKSTRFVPEVVFLDPRGEVVSRLNDRSVRGATAAMEKVLQSVKKGEDR